MARSWKKMVDYFSQAIVGESSAQAQMPTSSGLTERAHPSNRVAKAFLAFGAGLVLASSIYGYFLVASHTNAFERYSAAATLNNRAFQLATAVTNLEHAEQRFAEAGMEDEFADARQMLHNTMLTLAKMLESEQRDDARHVLGQLALRLDDHHQRMMTSQPDLNGLRDRTLFASLSMAQLRQPLLDLSALANNSSQEAAAYFKQISTQMW
jgi:hypothetical protein